MTVHGAQAAEHGVGYRIRASRLPRGLDNGAVNSVRSPPPLWSIFRKKPAPDLIGVEFGFRSKWTTQ
jgi:hypothetical protein